MSIDAMINEPITQEEKDFFIPISSNSIYENYWIKYANDNNSAWLPCFVMGSTVDYEYIPEVIRACPQFNLA